MDKSDTRATPYKPSRHEEAVAARFFARAEEAPSAPRMKVSEKDGVTEIAVDHPESAIAHILLMNALGTSDLDFLNGLLEQLENVATCGKKLDERALNFILSVAKGIEPKDQVEAMLAIQMAAVHMATMTFAGRLVHGQDISEQEGPERAFTKLARTFAAQVEALQRYRSKGEQMVAVAKVELHPDGQRLVEAAAADNSSEGQHHAKPVGHATQLAMRSSNAGRKTLPVARDAERTLPHARRDVARSTQRK